MKLSIALNIKRVLRAIPVDIFITLSSWCHPRILTAKLSLSLSRSRHCTDCGGHPLHVLHAYRPTTGNFLRRKRNLYVETQHKCQEIFRTEGRERPGPSSRPLLVLLTCVLETVLDAGVLALPDIWNVVRDCCMIRTIHLHSLDFSINWRYLIQFPNYFFISSRLN